MIESSITGSSWLEKMPRDRPTLIIAEGVLEYLTAKEVKTLLNRITDHFLHGQIAFDVVSSYAMKYGKKELKETTGAIHKWAVDDIDEEVDKLNPKLKRIAELSLFQSPNIRKLSWQFRVLYGIVSLIPRYKNMLTLLRYQF